MTTIEAYLDSLPEDITEINISYRKLTYIPKSIIRFKNLKQLYCDRNEIIALPILPQSLIHLYCNHNQIVTLPILPQSLTNLYCYCNQIIALPILPQSLTHLDCGSNKIINLAILPSSLTYLYCSDNNFENQYPDLEISTIRKIQRFKRKYYYWKCKAWFTEWMWRAREQIALREWHPDRMQEKIEAFGGDLEAVFGY